MSTDQGRSERQRAASLQAALEADESGALETIVRRGRDEDFEALRRVVGDDAEHRGRAIYALGRWGDPRAIDDIVRILPELGGLDRITAIDALGRLGGNTALAAVTRFVHDPSPQVRKVVVRALQRIGGEEADSTLRSMAREDPADWIRRLAAGDRER